MASTWSVLIPVLVPHIRWISFVLLTSINYIIYLYVLWLLLLSFLFRSISTFFHFSQREVSQRYLDQKNFSAWSSYRRSLTSVMMRLLMKTSGLGWYISETVKSQNLKTIRWFLSWTETFPGIHLRYLFVLFKDLETVHETVFDVKNKLK